MMSRDNLSHPLVRQIASQVDSDFLWAEAHEGSHAVKANHPAASDISRYPAPGPNPCREKGANQAAQASSTQGRETQGREEKLHRLIGKTKSKTFLPARECDMMSRGKLPHSIIRTLIAAHNFLQMKHCRIMAGRYTGKNKKIIYALSLSPNTLHLRPALPL